MGCNQDQCQPTVLYMKGSLHCSSLVLSLAAVQWEKCSKPDQSTLFSCQATLRTLAYLPHDTLGGTKGKPSHLENYYRREANSEEREVNWVDQCWVSGECILPV